MTYFITGGGTSTTSALTLVRTELMPLTEAVLGKKNLKSIVFILTDGKTYFLFYIHFAMVRKYTMEESEKELLDSKCYNG